jgi:hypothetical protein
MPVAPVVPAVVAVAVHAVGEVVALPIVDEAGGIVCIDVPSPTPPVIGSGLASGTAGVELTPRLPIS